MVIKLDIEMGYDRLDWNFFRKCFDNLGFCENGVTRSCNV